MTRKMFCPDCSAKIEVEYGIKTTTCPSCGRELVFAFANPATMDMGPDDPPFTHNNPSPYLGFLIYSTLCDILADKYEASITYTVRNGSALMKKRTNSGNYRDYILLEPSSD